MVFLNKRKLVLVLPAIIVLLAVLLAFWMVSTKEVIAPQPPKQRVYSVHGMQVNAQTHQPIQQLFSSLSTLKIQNLVAFSRGEVQQTSFDSGQWAQTGDVLIAFNQQDVNLTLDLARASLQEASAELSRTAVNQKSLTNQLADQKKLLALRKQQFEREKALSKGEFSTQNALESAEQAYLQQRLVINSVEEQVASLSINQQLAKARKQRAQSELQRAQLEQQRSTYEADRPLLVIKNNTKAGTTFAVGTQLMQTLALEDFEVEAALVTDQAQPLLDALNEGKKLQASIQYLGANLSFELHSIKGDAQAGSLVGVFKPTDIHQPHLKHLRLGMSLPLNLALPSMDEVFAVPFSSLYGRDTVYAVVSGALKKISVRYLGTVMAPKQAKKDKYWALLQLPSGMDQITLATTHLPNASEGLRVNVITP